MNDQVIIKTPCVSSRAVAMPFLRKINFLARQSNRKMRIWLSGPRIFGGLIRPGVSFDREDWNPRLPSYRRYALRHGLQKAAKATGETMTTEDANYAIDKALACGLLDSAGSLNFHAIGSRDEIVAQIIESGAIWDMPVTPKDAERIAGRAIRQIKFWRAFRAIVVFVIPAIIIGIIIVYAAAFRDITPARTPGFLHIGLSFSNYLILLVPQEEFEPTPSSSSMS
jgi:hypothetical protein